MHVSNLIIKSFYNFYFYQLFKYVPFLILCQILYISNKQLKKIIDILQIIKFSIKRIQKSSHLKIIETIVFNNFYLIYPFIYSKSITNLQHNMYKHIMYLYLMDNILLKEIMFIKNNIISFLLPINLIFNSQLVLLTDIVNIKYTVTVLFNILNNIYYELFICSCIKYLIQLLFSLFLPINLIILNNRI